MTTFAEGLKKALDDDNVMRSAGVEDGDRQQLRAFLDSNDHPVVKKLVLRRMERRTRNELGLSDKDKIDFGAIDWTTLIAKLMPLLLMILKIFFPVLPI